MTEADLAGLVAQVLLAAFVLAVMFGALVQRTGFCAMGAVADIVNIGDWTRMRMWLLAIGVAMIGFNAMVAAGWVQAGQSAYAGPQLLWLSNAVGGVLFGIGMVLASGCGSKALVRMGGGSLKALVVFFVLAFASAATLRGITAVARVNTVDRIAIDLAGGQDLPTLAAAAFGLTKAHAALALGALLGGALIVWTLSRVEGRSADVLLGGLGIGAVVAAMWWVSGRFGHVAEDPNTLQEALDRKSVV